MRTRAFTNNDFLFVKRLWTEKTRNFSAQYLPIDPAGDILEAQFFGDVLFDPKGLSIVSDDDGRDVGFIYASFAPNSEKSGCDEEKGIVYSPFIAQCVSDDEKIAVQDCLINAAEKYLRERGAKIAFAGGCPDGSPFMTGLYGPCSPPGLYDSDPDVDAFRRWNYERKGNRFEYLLNIRSYCPISSARFWNVRNGNEGATRAPWTSRFNWFDANVYRNFSSTQWLLSKNNDVLAGALVHTTSPLSRTRLKENAETNDSDERNVESGAVEFGPKRTILSFLAVQRSMVRGCLGSLLLSEMIEKMQATDGDVQLSAIVSPANEAFRKFLEYHSFLCARRFLVLCKTFDFQNN